MKAKMKENESQRLKPSARKLEERKRSNETLATSESIWKYQKKRRNQLMQSEISMKAAKIMQNENDAEEIMAGEKRRKRVI